MSFLYDKGKYSHSVIKRYPKTNQNNNNIINKNNIAKNKNDNKNIIKNTPLFHEYISSSPSGNNNRKKAQYLTTFQNYNDISNNQRNNNENINVIKNKRPQIKQLNFNKSFEGNLGKDYESKNFDLAKESLFRMKNNENKKKINKSMIINQKNKKINKNKKNNKSASKAIKAHHTLNPKRNNFAEKLLIKKLEDKFKSLEKNIIDKNYENEIDNEEMIISSRNNEKGSNTTRPQIKGKNIINDNLDINLDYENIFGNSDKDFINIIYDKLILNDNYDLDEDYLLNSSFENDRSDFNIMYTDNYGDTIMDDMLSLEIKLLIEKMIDIQKSYHKELDLLLNRYNQNSNMMKSLIEKIKILQKKILLIKKIKESRENKENIYNFLEKYKHNNHHDIYKINKNEFNLWNYILYDQKKKNDSYKKEKLINIFKRVIFERYNKITGKINNIENKIVLNLMKKYYHNLKGKRNNTKSNNNSNIAISHIQRQNLNKNLNTNKNKKLINNNKKHKKTSSCHSKPSKYAYFKNNQKPK